MNNKYNPVYIRRYNFKVDMTCCPIFNKSNTTCDTSEAGTAYPSGAHIVISAHVARSLAYCVVFGWPMFVFWLLHCVSCPSNYGFLFGIFKRFLEYNLIWFEYCNMIGWSAWRKFLLYLITWVVIVTSPTYAFDKFK